MFLCKAKALLVYRKLNSISLLSLLSPGYVFIRNTSTYCDYSTLVGQYPGFCSVLIFIKLLRLLLLLRIHRTQSIGPDFMFDVLLDISDD